MSSIKLVFTRVCFLSTCEFFLTCILNKVNNYKTNTIPKYENILPIEVCWAIVPT